MSDRLAQIEELRRSGQLGAISVSDVLALVETAKAARAALDDQGVPRDPITDAGYRAEMLRQWGAATVALVDALSVLDDREET